MAFKGVNNQSRDFWSEDSSEFNIPTSTKVGIGWLFAGLTIGMVSMFLLDPDKGERRRALLRDKFTKYSKDLQGFSGRYYHTMKNQLQGWETNLDKQQLNPSSSRRRLDSDDQSYN